MNQRNYHPQRCSRPYKTSPPLNLLLFICCERQLFKVIQQSSNELLTTGLVFKKFPLSYFKELEASVGLNSLALCGGYTRELRVQIQNTNRNLFSNWMKLVSSELQELEYESVVKTFWGHHVCSPSTKGLWNVDPIEGQSAPPHVPLTNAHTHKWKFVCYP